MTDMPRYNPGTPDYQPVQAPVAPPVMNIVFWLMLAAGLMSVVAAVFGVMNANSSTVRAQVEAELAKRGTPVTPEMLDTVMAFSLATVIGTAVVSVIAYVVLAIFVKKGMGWARIVAAVLAVLSLGQFIGLAMPGGIATTLQILLGLAAVALCFTGAGAAFFRARRDFKLATKGR
ncbi:hypothetical protein [Arthrobacter sp. HY1533]|uniref:hypothetical protein n=1 Tax=Arthrobacter sp. HY1533 TaxID=2970919 RepID=UPI0022B9DF66|nr:hypothetical protein [Arthrobacter sp. HY1533]